MLSHTARTRPVLRCSPLLSRQNKRKENSYKCAYKYGYKSGPSHMQSPANNIHRPKAITARGAKGTAYLLQQIQLIAFGSN
jgi:hypothetical protein